ncbi:MAG: ribonucleotide-diphosphate reductase subunit alpha, partial [Chloroflexota bacterium]|nr:ribonucleotide-diphosphate reductase subunit alpha [Chloroflexota bacterium]
PPDIKRLFLTATEMAPEWHISMQSIIQSYVDNSVSKTINLPHSTTVEEIKEIILAAHDTWHCKGLTLYRTGSRKDEVIASGSNEENDSETREVARVGEPQTLTSL